MCWEIYLLYTFLPSETRHQLWRWELQKLKEYFGGGYVAGYVSSSSFKVEDVAPKTLRSCRPETKFGRFFFIFNELNICIPASHTK